jgi:hypothetical protein
MQLCQSNLQSCDCPSFIQGGILTKY